MSKKACIAVVVSAMLLLLTGCATTLSASHRVSLGNSGRIRLLPPKDLPEIDGAHMVTLVRNGKKMMFIGQLRIDSRVIRLDGSSLFGLSLFEVSYNGHTLQSKSAGTFTHPAILVAMLDLILAKRHVLQGALRDLSLQQDSGSDGMRIRNIYEQGHLVMHIEISNAHVGQASIRLDLPAEHLSVLMQPLGNSIKP
ncbi:MAG: DUF3261 domain-containing protein [Gammaproteobacteria bacterium]